MPIISITLLPGYSKDAEAKVVNRVALAVRSVIAAPAAGTVVFVTHANTYQRDGRVYAAGNAERVDASALVEQFLHAVQARDLIAAKAFLALDFSLRFPGSGLLHSLEEAVEFSRGRYASIAKTVEKFDASWTEEGAVVYCFGTLNGVWLDGSVFEGIRFIDRFEIINGLISRQDVWNDLALHLAPHLPPQLPLDLPQA